ncbi:MAG: hypothetical protein U9N45_05510 [Gemmatimonadota bacterium]|nr:hypothetical protein [Gemmatimonadota bacterium]
MRLWDERDKEIERQSSLAGLWVFYMYYIATGIYFLFDPDKGPIGHHVFSMYFCIGILIFFTVLSLAITVLFGWSREKPGGVIETLRDMTKLQKESSIVLLGTGSILIVFLLLFPITGRKIEESALGLAFFLVAVFFFFVIPVAMKADDQDERDEAISHRAGRVRLWGLSITVLTGLLAIAVFYALRGPVAINLNLFSLVGFCGFSVGLLAFLVTVLVKSTSPREKDQGMRSNER